MTTDGTMESHVGLSVLLGGSEYTYSHNDPAVKATLERRHLHCWSDHENSTITGVSVKWKKLRCVCTSFSIGSIALTAVGRSRPVLQSKREKQRERENDGVRTHNLVTRIPKR